MRRIFSLLAFVLAFFGTQATADNLDLKDLCNGTYSARRIYGVNPLNDGLNYAQMSPDRTQILTYSFKTGEQTGVLFDANNIKGRIRIKNIDGYIMSPDESHILLQTQTKRIYRHSATAEYYICLLYTSPSPRDRG